MRRSMFATGAYMFALVSVAQAGTLTPLFAIPSHIDGAGSRGPLVRVGPKLYGTVGYGGAYGCGAVFSVDPKTAGATGRIGIAYSFTCGTDGGDPSASLALMGGKLFGTTDSGGESNSGTVFEVDPKTSAETTVCSFPTQQYLSAPLLGYHGLLYGTTPYGGTGQGSVFSVDPATGTEKTVHAFKGSERGGDDGDVPRAALIQSGGRLYGTTIYGGTARYGVIYRLDPDSGAVKTVYSFPGGTGGEYSQSPLLDMGGLLYGASAGGVAREGGAASCGTIYSVDPASGNEAVAYSFPGEAGGCSPDVTPVLLDGKLYGVTGSARREKGTVYAFDPAAGTTAVLHSFKAGEEPTASLTAVGNRLYGVASQCCDYGEGQGLLFSIDASTGRVNTLYSFTNGADGRFPDSTLAHVDGAFYGTSSFAQSEGLVFKFVP